MTNNKQGKERRTRHHLHPSSRCVREELKLDKRNWKQIRERQHQAFHRLFSNMVPVEMIRHLAHEWTPPHIRFTRIYVESYYGVTYRYELNGPLKTVGNVSGGRPKKDQLAWQLVFGRHVDVFDAMVRIVEEWSPRAPYWRKVIIKAETDQELLEYTYISHRRRRKR